MPEYKRSFIITRYDESIKEPPFKTIPIDTMQVWEPEEDHLGELFYLRIANACVAKGYRMKFYTTSRTAEHDFEVVVH